jgi:hypothetical protein
MDRTRRSSAEPADTPFTHKLNAWSDVKSAEQSLVQLQRKVAKMQQEEARLLAQARGKRQRTQEYLEKKQAPSELMKTVDHNATLPSLSAELTGKRLYEARMAEQQRIQEERMRVQQAKRDEYLSSRRETNQQLRKLSRDQQAVQQHRRLQYEEARLSKHEAAERVVQHKLSLQEKTRESTEADAQMLEARKREVLREAKRYAQMERELAEKVLRAEQENAKAQREWEASHDP